MTDAYPNTATQPAGWFAAGRCKGIFRYHFLSLGKVVLWVLAILLGSQLLATLLPLLFQSNFQGSHFSSTGVSSDVGTVILLALICGNIVAGRSTRFLLRFGTSRFSVWLCNVLSLIAAMFALLIGCLLLSILSGYVTLWLSNAYPSIFSLQQYTADGIIRGEAALSASLQQTFTNLPKHFLWVAEWVCLFYLLGCCMRRSRGWTLAVIIGVPLALLLLMVVPAVRETVDTVRYANSDNELMILGMQWLQWFSKAARFIAEQWQWIQLGAAVASLPLSYLCMRTTKQP